MSAPFRPARKPLVLALVVLAQALLLSGCGVAYRSSHRTIEVGENKGSDGTLLSDAGFGFSMPVHEITVSDRTGIMLALFGTMADAQHARNEELKDMSKRGATEGSYTYEVTPVVPGPDFRMMLQYGTGTGYDVSLGGYTAAFDQAETRVLGYGFGFDTGSLRLHRRLLLDFTAECSFYSYRGVLDSATQETYTLFGDTEREPFYIPVYSRLSYLITPRLRLSGVVGYDVLQSLLGAIPSIGGGQLYSTRAELMCAVTPWLMLDAGVGRQSLSDGTGDFLSGISDVSGWVGVRLEKY